MQASGRHWQRNTWTTGTVFTRDGETVRTGTIKSKMWPAKIGR